MIGAGGRLLARLHEDDLRLLTRWALPSQHRPAARWFWIGVTQLGSTGVTVCTSLLIPLLVLPRNPGGWLPAASLAASFLVAQAIKRSVQRGRPVREPVIPCPDRFSFPSGHATASLAIALSLGAVVPGLALPLLVAGLLVGWSRVVLGVHYPGDVLAGQLIASLTVLALS